MMSDASSLCGALGGSILDSVVVAATGSYVVPWPLAASSSAAWKAGTTATASRRHTAWLFRSILMVVVLIFATVSTSSGRWSTHAPSAAVIIAAEETSRATTTSTLAGTILAVHHLILVHVAIVVHWWSITAGSSRRWTIGVGISSTATWTEAATTAARLKWLLLHLVLLRLLLLLQWLFAILSIMFMIFHHITVLGVGPACAVTTTTLLPPLTVTTTFLGGIGTALDRFTLGTSNIGCLIALLSDDYVELNHLTIADRTDGLFRVVTSNGRLVHKYIFLRIATIDETISALNVEPFDHTGNLGGNDFLLLLWNHRFVIRRRLLFRLLLLLLLGWRRLLLLLGLLLRRRLLLLLLLLRLLGLLFWRTYCLLVSHVVIALPACSGVQTALHFFELEKLRC